MSKCSGCGREMIDSTGCRFNAIRLKADPKQIIKRYKVGEHDGIEPGSRCGDCGAEYGYFHHPYCDLETCPVCGGQMLGCDCYIGFEED